MTEKTAQRVAVALEQLVILVNSARQQLTMIADELAVIRRMEGRERGHKTTHWRMR